MGQHADVADERNPGSGDGPDLGQDGRAALQFDGIGTGLHERPGAGEGFLRGLVGMPWQVAADGGPGDAPADASGMVHHVGEGDIDRIRIAKRYHAETVSDEDEIDPGLIQQPPGGIIRGGEHDDLAAGGFQGAKSGEPRRRVGGVHGGKP